MENKKSNWIVVLVILIVLFIFAIGYFLIITKDSGINKYDNADVVKNSQISRLASLYNEGDLDAAIAEAERYAEGGDVTAMLALASIYAQKASISFEEGEYGRKALEVVDKVLAVDPKNSEAYRIAGYVYEINNQYDKSIEAYDTSIELDSSNALAYSNRGHAKWLLAGENDSATSDYKKALEIDPVLEHALSGLSTIYMQEGKYAEAKELLDALVDITENMRAKAESLSKLSSLVLFQDSANVKQSRDYVESALQADDTLATAWVQRAWVNFVEIQNVEKVTEEVVNASVNASLKDLRKAIEIDPYLTNAYLTAANIFFFFGDQPNALSNLELASVAVEQDITLSAPAKVEMKQKISDLKEVVTNAKYKEGVEIELPTIN